MRFKKILHFVFIIRVGGLALFMLFCGMGIKKYFLLAAVLLQQGISSAQSPVPPVYPKGYFRNPLDIPIVLAGNFAECRPNHFHGGLDIKTEGRENMPVYAAADGYVARVKIEKAGYGHVLYINHPNGYTTAYAHLNDFMKPLAQHVHKKQYENEKAELDLSFKPGEFPVKKGDQIALSGNTGGSTAPHLHFEIRKTENEHALNPQLFGFEINDKIPPKIRKIAIYDMTERMYEQTPALYNVELHEGNYYVKDTIIVHSTYSGIGVVTEDYMNGSTNTLTYGLMNMYLSDALNITVRLNNIDFNETRYMNAYVDYKQKYLTGEWIQCLFQTEGNLLETIYEYTSNYKRLSQKGKVELGPNSPRQIKLEFIDGAGNTANVYLQMKHVPKPEKAEPECAKTFKLGKNSFATQEVALVMDENSIYEPLCFDFKSTPDAAAYSNRLQIHKPYVPVHKYFGLYINPTKPVPEHLQHKMTLVCNDGKDETAIAAEYNDGWYKAKVRKFGEYRLVPDTTAPAIKPTQPDGSNYGKASAMVMNVSETGTSVASFRAELNGKWLCFEARPGDKFIYTFDEYCPKGKHKLNITATDENGNKSTLVYNFTR